MSRRDAKASSPSARSGPALDGRPTPANTSCTCEPSLSATGRRTKARTSPCRQTALAFAWRRDRHESHSPVKRLPPYLSNARRLTFT
jgi:hypothetical protein